MPIGTLDLDTRDVEACLHGEGQGFARLVQRHQPGAMRLAWQLLGERTAAEDAVQEAFVRAWRALPGLRQPGRFRSWLFKTTANVCRDRLRKPTPEVSWDDRVPAPSAPGPEALYETGELQSRTTEAIRKLPPAYRILVALRHGEALSYQEMADTLGLPLSVIKNRMYRARRMLKQSLSDYLAEKGGPLP